MQRKWISVVLCAVLALVPACKKASESAAEKAAERAMERATGNKADVDLSGGQVKVTGKEDGKEFSFQASDKGGVELPNDFPADIPRYPGATVMSSMVQGDAMVMVNLQTGDPIAEVYAFYGRKLRSGGWEIVTEVTMPEMRMVSGKKGERQASVTVHGGEGKTDISVVYGGGKG